MHDVIGSEAHNLSWIRPDFCVRIIRDLLFTSMFGFKEKGRQCKLSPSAQDVAIAGCSTPRPPIEE